MFEYLKFEVGGFFYGYRTIVKKQKIQGSPKGGACLLGHSSGENKAIVI